MIQRLINQITEKNAPIVVGLDPTMKLMPKSLVEKHMAEQGQTLEAVGEAMFDYNRQIMDAFQLLSLRLPCMKALASQV